MLPAFSSSKISWHYAYQEKENKHLRFFLYSFWIIIFILISQNILDRKEIKSNFKNKKNQTNKISHVSIFQSPYKDTLKKSIVSFVAFLGQRKREEKREWPVMDQQIKWENRFSTKERNLLYLERADYPIWRVIKPVTTVQKGGSNSVWISFSFRIESNRVESNEGTDRIVPSTRFNLCQIRRRRPMMCSLYPPSRPRTLCHSFETLCQAWFNYARSAVVEATSA